MREDWTTIKIPRELDKKLSMLKQEGLIISKSQAVVNAVNMWMERKAWRTK